MSKSRLMLQLIVILLLSILLTGCWDYRELSDLAIVAGVAIDLADEPGKVIITSQVIKPREFTNAGEGAYINVGAPGYTPFESVRFATTEFDRRLYFSHAKVMIISQELAEQQDIRPFLDFFARDVEPRGDMNVLIAAGKAKDLLEVKPNMEQVPALGLAELVITCQATGQVCVRKYSEFIQMLTNKTTAAHATYAEVYEEKGQKKPRYVGSAVFKEGKMVGTLDKAQTRGMLFVTNRVKGGIIVVDAPGGGKASLEIIDSRTKVTPQVKDDQISIKIEVVITSNLGGTTGFTDLTTPLFMASLRRRQAAVVRSEIMQAVEQAKEWKADFLKFNEVVYRKFPREWKKLEPRWDEVFPNIDVQIEVKSEVRLSGLTTNPVRPL